MFDVYYVGMEPFLRYVPDPPTPVAVTRPIHISTKHEPPPEPYNNIRFIALGALFGASVVMCITCLANA